MKQKTEPNSNLLLRTNSITVAVCSKTEAIMKVKKAELEK